MLATGVVISEFMTDNYSSILDWNDDHSDWLEIENDSGATVDLKNWYLTDNPANLKKWQFPVATVLADGQRQLVFASGDTFISTSHPSVAPNGELHASFKLNKGGGYLALVMPDGVTVSWEYGSHFEPLTEYPAQREDVSFGLIAGNDTVVFFGTPSPGTANNTGLAAFAPEPEYRVSGVAGTGGLFTDNFQLELYSPIPGATIRYTTNRTVPTSSSTIYTAPISVTGTIQVRAFVSAPGHVSSEIRSETYAKLGADLQNFQSTLPIVVVENFGQGLPNAPRQDSYIAVFQQGVDGLTTLSDPDDLDVDARAGVSDRGATSAGQPKRNMRVEIRRDDSSTNPIDNSDDDRNISPYGLPAESDWILHAPYHWDRAYIRNPLIYELSNQIGVYATRYRFVEVFLDAYGEDLTYDDYMGVYVLMETIKRDPQRVDVAELGTRHTSDPYVTGGYLIKIDRPDPGDQGFVAGGQTWRWVNPTEMEMETAQRDPQEQYLRSYLDTVGSVLNGAGFADPATGYAAYIDVDATIDHHLLNVLMNNVDALVLSTYLYKDRNGKLTWGPIWDFDRSAGSRDPRDDNPYIWQLPGGTQHFKANWWARMFQDPNFSQAWIDRWQELRSTTFSDDNISSVIDSMANELINVSNPTDRNDPANPIVRNFRRWVDVNPRLNVYLNEIDDLRNWLLAHAGWIDERFLAPTTMSHSGGVFSDEVSLAMSAAQGEVWYTTDGTDPRASGGGLSASAVQYTGPITIGESTVVNARSYFPTSPGVADGPPTGKRWSGPTAATFVIDLPTLTISELNYHPLAPSTAEQNAMFTDNELFEFIEIYNYGPQAIAGQTLAGVQVMDDANVTFSFATSSITSIASGERVVVVHDLAAFQARYPGVAASSIAGEFIDPEDGLSNGGDEITLVDGFGTVLADADYNDGWYSLTDDETLGFTLTRRAATEADPLADLTDDRSWRPSSLPLGTPAAADQGLAPDPGDVVVNEIFPHSDTVDGDWIEFHNTTSQDIPIGGWYVSDDPTDPLKYRFPNGSSIPAGQYFVITQFGQFGNAAAPGTITPFGLSEFGDEVVLTAATTAGERIGFLETEDFTATVNGMAWGRYIKSTGRKDFIPVVEPTMSTANTAPRIGPIVLHEVLYNPTSGSEYIELKNISNAAVPLYDTNNPANRWTIQGIGPIGGGVGDFAFPANITVPAGGLLLVVPTDPAAFRATHSVPASVQIVGPYTGALNNGGETLRLLYPDAPDLQAQIVPMILEDRLAYDNKPPWPTAAGDQGASIQRLDAEAYGNDPINWAASFLGGTPGSQLPKVSEVLVSGSTWTPSFLNYIATLGLGDGGISIGTGVQQLDAFSWASVDQVKIRFNDDVFVQQSALTVLGVNRAEYAIADFAYDAASRLATWTLAVPIRADKIRLELLSAATGSGGVAGGGGAGLDGNWQDTVSDFASGNNVIDLDDNFRFRFNVLPGDVAHAGSTSGAALIDIVRRLGRDTSSPDYDYLLDLTADGRITMSDLRTLLRSIPSTLPAGEPAESLGTQLEATDDLFDRLGGGGGAVFDLVNERPIALPIFDSESVSRRPRWRFANSTRPFAVRDSMEQSTSESQRLLYRRPRLDRTSLERIFTTGLGRRVANSLLVNGDWHLAGTLASD